MSFPQTPLETPPAEDSPFQRLALITGNEALEKIAHARVLVFGLGGVGSWCAEALVRSGLGTIGIIDFDTICASNINRQIQATSRTAGLPKARVLRERLLEINPDCKVTALEKMFSRENAGEFAIADADYVIDAIDTLDNKIALIEFTRAAGVTLFSSMGMARKMNPTLIKTAGIWDTHGCPLARRVREGLRKRGFQDSFTAVYSDEPPCGQTAAGNTPQNNAPPSGKQVNGSAVTVTACAGMILASLVLRDITTHTEEK